MTDTPTAPPVSLREFTTAVDVPKWTNHYRTPDLFLVDDRHPAVQSQLSVRAANTFLTGQVAVKRLAEVTRFSAETLNGELGGAMPMEANDPDKGLVLRTVEALVNAIWVRMPDWAGKLPINLDIDLCDVVETHPESFPEIDPVIDEQYEFAGVRMLYKAAGGIFSMLVGLAFVYENDFGGRRDLRLMLSDLENHPHREAATLLIRHVMQFRNVRTDVHATKILEDVVTTVVLDVMDGKIVAATAEKASSTVDEALNRAVYRAIERH